MTDESAAKKHKPSPAAAGWYEPYSGDVAKLKWLALTVEVRPQWLALAGSHWRETVILLTLSLHRHHNTC